MKATRTYRYFAVLVTALFLLLQGASLSHAASYGSAPHEHNGVLCVLSLQNEADTAVPAPQISFIAPALTGDSPLVFETDFISAPKRSYRGREPPPRGPPSLQR